MDGNNINIIKKKGIYIYPGSNTEFTGVNKKINDQIKALSDWFDVDMIVLEKENADVMHKILWRMPFGSWGAKYDEILNTLRLETEQRKFDFIYIRAQALDKRYIGFLKRLREYHSSALILLEMPTFPYDKEYLQNWAMWPWFFKDRVYRRKMRKYINRIVTFTDDMKIFGIDTIRTCNGICVGDITMPERNEWDVNGPQSVNLLAVARFQKSHGYERIIRGLSEYYSGNYTITVALHMVGDGPERKRYERLVSEYKLQKYVLFYGTLTGKELEKVYAIADMGMGCFGLFKRGINKSSALKIREYLAYGLPVVSGVNEDAFTKGCEFFFELPNNRSIISIKDIIQFYFGLTRRYNRLNMNHLIREYARKNLDVSVTMWPIIEYLAENMNIQEEKKK